MKLVFGKDYQIERLTEKSQAEECVEVMQGVDTWETLQIPFYKMTDIFMEPNRETHLAVKDGRIIGLIMLRMDGRSSDISNSFPYIPTGRAKALDRA